MKISGIDVNITKQWDCATAREDAETSRREKQENEMQQEGADAEEFDVNMNEPQTETISETGDSDYIPPAGQTDDSQKQNRTKLPRFGAMCDRYGVSDRAAAALASALLEDYGIITETDRSQVIGPRKVAYERHKYREERREMEFAALDNITSIYFDGKKTATRVMERNDKTGRWNRKVVVQDHYVIITEPGSQYLGHVTPKSGHGKSIAEAIYTFLVDNNLTDHPITCVGADGTNVNVGANNGSIQYLEMMLGRPLQFSICQLHGNELPFHAVFYHYDGKPKGPDHWRGPIGQMIKQPLANLPIVSFQPVPFSDFPQLAPEVQQDLSWDQNYLMRMCIAVMDGNVSKELAALEPGSPFISRWITLWCRNLRVYVSTEKPSPELKRIVNMIIKFSAPMWFTIKCNPYFIHGAKNTFRAIQLMRNLNKQEKIIAKKAVQRNAFFAHPDQVLLSMCADDDEAVRQKVVKMIQELRQQKREDAEKSRGEIKEQNDDNDDEIDSVDQELLIPTDDENSSSDDEKSSSDEEKLGRNIRRLVIPRLNWQARNYHTMLDWKYLVTEPPFIAKLSSAEIQSIVQYPLVVPKWYNHTQAVERAIKVMCEASAAVTGPEERDGFIRQRLFARKMMPNMNSKKDYNFTLQL